MLSKTFSLNYSGQLMGLRGIPGLLQKCSFRRRQDAFQLSTAKKCLRIWTHGSWLTLLKLGRSTDPVLLKPCTNLGHLKGLSHEIFRPVFWPVWMHLGLNVNRLWFWNFYEAPLIFGNYFKFWCVSYQTFSEIRRISEKDWQLSYRNSCVVEEPSRRTAELVFNHSRKFYKSSRSIDTLYSVSRRTANPE